MDLTWKYSTRHRPSAPVIELGIRGFPLELLVDTGFSGGILIPFPLFQSLRLMSRLVPDVYTAVLPDSRKLPVYTASEEVTIGSSRVITHVHSSPAMDRSLLGREALRSFLALLDGPKESLTLSTRP